MMAATSRLARSDRHAPSMLVFAASWSLLAATGAVAQAYEPEDRPAETVYVGIEARVRYVVPNRDGIPLLVGVSDSAAMPASPTPDVRVRMVSRRELDGATELTLGVIASLPGAFDIAPLMRVVSPAAGGSPAPDRLPPLRINVWSSLPEDHDGRVSEADLGLRVRKSGYPIWIGALALLWLTPIGVLIARRMRTPTPDTPAPLPPPPTLADKLRPLTDRVRTGDRDPTILAEMERLLLHAMRARVRASTASVRDSIGLLRTDAQCGPLLVGLERWLHGPRSEQPSDAEVDGLLRPFESLAIGGDGEGTANDAGGART